MMPISCMECRRRKIKCNRMVPCNQCTVKDKKCEYPQKFRSIEIDHLVVEEKIPKSVSLPVSLSGSRMGSLNDVNTIPIMDKAASGSSIDSKTLVRSEEPPSKKRKSSDSPAADVNIDSLPLVDHLEIPQIFNENETATLLKENEALKLKIRDLKLKTKRQRTKLKNLNSKVISYSDLEEDSDDNAIDEEGKQESTSRQSTEINNNYYGPNSTEFMMNSSLKKKKFDKHDNFINNKKYQKRSLPQLITPKSNSVKAKNTAAKENLEVITKLVKKLMHIKVYYVNYMNVNFILEFLNNYEEGCQWNTDDDDKLMLIIMILITSLRSLPLKDPIVSKYKLSYKKNRPLLYKQYKIVKDSIHHQSTTVLRAYALECEDLFFNDRIEQSWDVLFLSVSMAYSLGLHVYDQSIANTLQDENLDNAGEIIRKNEKSSLWFIINFISATLCSVLGRPNPVTFNFQPLFKNYEIRLNYKMALADLINQSTNILIDSYKVQIDHDIVMGIDNAYVNESLIYEKILVDTRIMKSLASRDKSRASFITLPVIDKSKLERNFIGNNKKGTFKNLSELNLPKLIQDCPLDIRFTILRPCPLNAEEEDFCMILEDSDTLCDLILLHGNRAKFNQHFMLRFKLAFESCIDSCKKVLDHSLDLVELLHRKFGSPKFHSIYPFFYVFLYQTFIVIYTIMHTNFTMLKPYSSNVEILRNKLFKLFDAVGTDNWKPKVVKLIRSINEMCDSFFKNVADFESGLISTAQFDDSSSLTPKILNSEWFHDPSNTIKENRDSNILMTPLQDSAHSFNVASHNNIPVYNVPDSVAKQLDVGDNNKSKFSPGYPVQRFNNSARGAMDLVPEEQFSKTQKFPSFSRLSLLNLNDFSHSNSDNRLTTPTIQQTPSFAKLFSPKNDNPAAFNNNLLTQSYNNMLDLNDPFHIQFPFNFNYAATDDTPGSAEDTPESNDI